MRLKEAPKIGGIMELVIDGQSLTIGQVHAVAREHATVVISEGAKERVVANAKLVIELVDAGEALYGITTGIGEFARIRISKDQAEDLQYRIIRSHAAGTGNYFDEEYVRAAMVIRANVLSKGYSGVRLSCLQTYVDMINRNIIPLVHEKGSLGVSGDLSPMSQIAEVAIGEGEAWYQGERLSGADAMKKAGLEPIKLTYKEGLGLINGSQMFTGVGALTLFDSIKLVKTAQIACAMTVDALKSVMKAYDERLHKVRPYHGQNAVAKNIRTLVEGSQIMADRSGKVQDGYSLRCVGQVIGPTVDALEYIKGQIEIEINSASDNPLFFTEDKVSITGGNFHGQPIAMALDLLGIALANIGNLCERHINRLLNPVLSGLPDFLVEGKGLNSGLMVAHYTAAALVSENKVLSHPASVDSISVSADQEDHVSMGPGAAFTARDILENLRGVISIQLMCATQAMDFRKPLEPGKGTKVAYDEVRKVVTKLEDDRVLYPDIASIKGLIRDDSILNAVEDAVGPLIW